jgi:hypothetical protein
MPQVQVHRHFVCGHHELPETLVASEEVVRQVLGAITEFDKAMTVAELRGARDRKRRANGKCEGLKSLRCTREWCEKPND